MRVHVHACTSIDRYRHGSLGLLRVPRNELVGLAPHLNEPCSAPSERLTGSCFHGPVNLSLGYNIRSRARSGSKPGLCIGKKRLALREDVMTAANTGMGAFALCVYAEVAAANLQHPATLSAGLETRPRQGKPSSTPRVPAKTGHERLE